MSTESPKSARGPAMESFRLFRAWGAVLSIALLGSGCRPGTGPREGGPRAEAEPAEQRAVSVGSGLVRVSYRIHNRGDRPLLLGEISSSCGCTSATVDATSIRPGFAATVRVEARPPTSGVSSVQVAVPTNDPASKRLILHLNIQKLQPVPHLVGPKPDLALGLLRSDAPPGGLELSFQVLEYQASPPLVQSLGCSLDPFRWAGGLAEEHPAADSGQRLRRYQFRGELTGPPAPGPFSGEVLLLGADGRPALPDRIPIHGVFREPVYASPASIRVAASPADRSDPRWVTVVAADPGFELTADCPDPDPAVSVRVAERRPGQVRFVIEFVPSMDLPSRPITLRTNHPAAATITVPIQVIPSSRKRPDD